MTPPEPEAAVVEDAPSWLDELEPVLEEIPPEPEAAVVEDAPREPDAVEPVVEEMPPEPEAVLIENCYISENPIPPEQEQVFVGREDLFAKLEENLAIVNKPTLILHGQRRTGKTSLLLQLPNRLPANYIPVYVDLQKTISTDGVNRFLYTLAHTTVLQANEKRHITLPPAKLENFEQRGPRAFYEWLGQAYPHLDGRVLLFALDEFEKIEEAIDQDRMGIVVLDILRHLIQQYSSWFVILFAGVRTLEEMSRNWRSYFVNVRPIHVSYLDSDAARKLIQLPSVAHSIRYDKEIAKAILKATRAQPYLVQVVCSELVQYLNSPDRRMAGPFERATFNDAWEAIRRGMRSVHPYLADLWENFGTLERLILTNLAHGQSAWMYISELIEGADAPLGAIHQAIDKLKRRELIEGSGRAYRFQMPMIQQWIREAVSLETMCVINQPPLDARGQE